MNSRHILIAIENGSKFIEQKSNQKLGEKIVGRQRRHRLLWEKLELERESLVA